ncbi:MAG: F0F1 ATP synthase subunit A [Bacteroidales bacterium]|nr:F0F1 ATP synthase subunit A [Bacteroidales bacterium]
MKKILYIILFICLCVPFGARCENADKGKEDFNAGEMIMKHLGDEHSWEICNFQGHEIAIPLPVILWNEGHLTCFMSNKLHEGKTYKNFRFGTTEDSKTLEGKIIYVDENNAFVSKPLDFSITKNVFSIFIVCTIICCVVITASQRAKKREGKEPKGVQTLIEMFVEFIKDDIAIPNIGKEAYGKYMTYLLSVFLFIFLCNIMGLIPFFPGGANVSGNIAVTLTLALFTFFVVMFSSSKGYWKGIVNPNVPMWLKLPVPLMPVLEFIEIFTKPFSLCIRLFANITAGHVIMLSFVGIIFIFGTINNITAYGVGVASVLFSVFMTMIEALVAFIQAYVFTLLSAIYIGMARSSHE